MANHNCNQNCGCTDTYTVSAPCPPSCAEVFNAQCIVYTGTDILCGQNTVIRRYDYLDTIITKLVNYICSNFTLPAYNVVGSENITVTTTTIGNTTTFTLLALETILENTDNLLNITIDTTPGIDIIYTVNIDVPALTNVIPLTAVAAGPSANSFITSSVVGNLTTYSVDSKESIVTAGANVVVTSSGGGAPSYDTTYTIDGKESIVAAGAGVSVVATGGGAPNYDTTYTVSADTTTLTSAGGIYSLVNDGTGPTLAIKGITSGTGISINSIPGVLTISATLEKAGTVPLTGNQTITHNLGTTLFVVSVVQAGVAPLNSFVHGIDYTYAIIDPNTITITEVVPGVLGTYQVCTIG